jgi:hypothetical protein
VIAVVKWLARWLSDRQPRVLDYILIAVIGAVLAAIVIAVADGSQGSDAPTGARTVTNPLDGGPSTGTVAHTVSNPTPPTEAAARTFYAPGGDISCSLRSDSARCSVISADRTFVLPRGGGFAYAEPGIAVPAYAGSEAPYASEQSEGAIVCTIPPESVPAGLTCRDGASRHGFVASRVGSRQRVF